MGGGNWDPDTYDQVTRARIQSNTSFAYSGATFTQPREEWKAHEELDPLLKAGPTSPFAGENVRESRDSDEHPLSVPMAVFFDETGSMDRAPRTIQEKLAGLFGLLLRKGYCEDPQVMVGAYGDTWCDQVPVQVGQFESDNRIDEELDKLFLEGNGGGNNGEDMAMMWYFLRYHTATDAWDKREKRGYAFFIGDEVAHPLDADRIKKHFGDGEPLGDLDHEKLVASLLERWDAYVLIENNPTAKMQKSVDFYTALFGKERVIILETVETVAETIGLLVGMGEGTIDLDDGVDDLKELGFSDSDIASTKKALEPHRGNGGGKLVSAGVPDDMDDDSSSTDPVDRV